MAKSKSIQTDANGVVKCCENCANNIGENMKFRYMWKCAFIPYCTPFGWKGCKAEELRQGSFKAK